MVVITEICSYSELRIYPGRGQRFVAKDGRGFLFLSKKAKCLSLRKVKAQNITWTTAWRRANKKIKTDDINKKKRKRATNVERAISGITLEKLNATRNAKPAEKKAQAESILREIKERKAKAMQTKAKNAPKAAKDTKQQQKAQQTAQKKTKGADKKRK